MQLSIGVFSLFFFPLFSEDSLLLVFLITVAKYCLEADQG